jgi:hypothetical protein
MTFTVVYDANVLYPNTLRDLLIRIAQSGMVQAKWTSEILDEMVTALSRNRPDIPENELLMMVIRGGAREVQDGSRPGSLNFGFLTLPSLGHRGGDRLGRGLL